MEENILKWLEVGDSIQKLDVYSNKFRMTGFKIFYNISKNMYFSKYLHYLLIIIFFAQIWELNISGTNLENDGVLKIIDFFKPILLFEKMIDGEESYEILLIIAIIFFLLVVILSSINMIAITKNLIFDTLLKILGFIQLITVYYLSGPLLHIYVFPLFIPNEAISVKNLFLFVVFILGLIFCVSMILNVLMISFYMNDINTISENNYKSKINDRYMTLILIIKLIYFIFESLLVLVFPNNNLFLYFHQIVFLVFNILISIYSYRNVYYYNYTIDILHHFGWYFSTWLSICVLFKHLSNTKDMTLFLIIGFILIGVSSVFSKRYKIFKLLTEFNILAGNSLKDIEMYTNHLFQLSEKDDPKSITLLSGIIKKSEECLKSSPELNEIYTKFVSKAEEHKLFNSTKELKVFCIIGIIYVNNEEKSKNKVDISLNRCYYSLNKLKNISLTTFIASKIIPETHIQAYYKYILLEEIKAFIKNKIRKARGGNKASLKNLQMSTVILYSQLVDLFKIEIYDAACSQIEYFDILKNNITTEKTTENFLKTGENILSLRNNIITIWNKMIDLNPLDSESEKDYLIYLDVVIQDEILKKEEMKKYKDKKEEFYSERHHIYFDMFNHEKSAILLCDGYTFNGKILYYTPNFASLFGFTEKEILNITIEDLLPDVVQNFHKYILEENMKYTNLMAIFRDKRNLLLKGKNGLLFNIYLYLRILPNMEYGLIYILYIQKIEEKNFMIILDEKMHIDGFTESGQMNSNFTVNNVGNFGLSQLVIGYHIGMIIPSIIFQMDYDTKNKRFFFLKENMDLKGFFYSTHNTKEMSVKIQKILDIIIEKKNLDNEEEENGKDKLNISDEFNDFIKELNSQNIRPYSIFYRIECRKFIDGKYRYYKIYITNDLLSDNFNDIISNTKNNLISNPGFNIKDNNSKSDNNAKNNEKLIKLKINSNKTNVDNIKKKINKDGDNTSNNNNSKDFNINQNNINFSQPTSSSSSVLSKTNRETSEFHKLKNEIIKKKDFTNIRILKYLVFIYINYIFTLVAYDYVYNSAKIKSLSKFLQENLYFDGTKIACANIYNTAFNLWLLRNDIINNTNCPNSNCTSFYADLLVKSYTEVRKLKYDLNNFFEDYQDIFKKKMKVESKRFKFPESEYLYLDIDNYLNFLISNGLKITANISNYFSNEGGFFNFSSNEIIDVYINNLLSASYNFFYSDVFKGFEGKEKTKRYLKHSNNPPKRLILSLVGFLLAIIILINLVCRIYSSEIFYLDKLMNFSSTNFEEYLKKLNDIKKSLRDENNDDEDKNLDDIDNDDEFREKNENDDDNKNVNKNQEIKNKKKVNMKKKKNKQNKLYLQKLKKTKNMSNYFLRFNFLFTIKLAVSFLIFIIYFIITILLYSNYQKNFNNFDNSLIEVNKIYLNIFNTLLNFKKIIEKFTYQNETDITIPNDTELTQPKLGNTLFDILHNSKYSTEYLDTIKNLYNENACEVLNKNIDNDTYCETLFSSVLLKGLDQVIVQMSIIINNCIDDLTMLKKTKNLKDFYSIDNYYYKYEILVGYYIFNSFLVTVNAFDVFRENEIEYITRIRGIIIAVFSVFIFLIIILCFYFVYQFKTIGNSFWNFIGILPNKFISDDENFYDSIIKLGKLLY